MLRCEECSYKRVLRKKVKRGEQSLAAGLALFGLLLHTKPLERGDRHNHIILRGTSVREKWNKWVTVQFPKAQSCLFLRLRLALQSPCHILRWRGELETTVAPSSSEHSAFPSDSTEIPMVGHRPNIVLKIAFERKSGSERQFNGKKKNYSLKSVWMLMFCWEFYFDLLRRRSINNKELSIFMAKAIW